jgi:hypothetical protein
VKFVVYTGFGKTFSFVDKDDLSNYHASMQTLRRIKLLTLLLVLMVSGLFTPACRSQQTERQAIAAAYPGDPTTTVALAFSTYIGGSRQDSIRDVATDSQGNIYITGGTESPNFPTTAGAYDTTFNGWHDVYVIKFDPEGKLIWSTFIGGPNYDRAYAIEVDSEGYVYVAGRAGPGFPVTSGALQTAFQGFYTGGLYGDQNAFIAKLTPDGKNLVFATYFGVDALNRDLAIDQNGDIYVPLGYRNKGNAPPSEWLTNAFQKTPQGGTDSGVAKIKSDGSRVLWATYLGGLSDDGAGPSIRVDAAGFVYTVMQTKSDDIPTTTGAYDRMFNGSWDMYVAKLTPDGSNLVFGTYLGGSRDEFNSAHQLALDGQGNVYVATWTASPDFPTTGGTVQTAYGGGNSDVGLAKISADGTQLLASTFLGGSGNENVEGIAVDALGNVYISGTTGSNNFPVMIDAFQANNRGGDDGFLAKLSSDLNQLLYSTYMGGSGDDGSRSIALDVEGNFFFAGWTKSNDFPTINAFQTSRRGDWDIALAKFVLGARTGKTQ